MSPNRRVLAVTSIRADYDLLSGVYRALAERPGIDFGVVVSSAHLSATFGNTVSLVRADDIPIVAEIECLLDSDSRAGRAKTGAILMQSLVDVMRVWNPDVVLFPGDREDALVAATVAAYMCIPSVHFFGGDHATDGNVDNPVRHAISKLATAHFVAHPEHRRRLLALGEPANRVFLVGNPALDRLKSEPALDRQAVLEAAGVHAERPSQDYALLIHHAILGNEHEGAAEIVAIIEELLARGIDVLIGSPNTDAGSREVLRAIEGRRGSPGTYIYGNLPRNLFVNAMRHASLIIGNSSMGLLESASLPKAAVNVGLRQRGRLAPPNVIFVDGTRPQIGVAIDRARSPDFQAMLAGLTNPYGDGKSIPRIVDLIATTDFAPLARKTEDPLVVAAAKS